MCNKFTISIKYYHAVTFLYLSLKLEICVQHKSYNDLYHILIILLNILSFILTRLNKTLCSNLRSLANTMITQATNLCLDMFPDHVFSAMVNYNITRTTKQLTATLVKVFAETIPCLSEGFGFLANGGVVAGLM